MDIPSASSLQPSSSKPNTKARSSNDGNAMSIAYIGLLNEDLLQNILARLPALDFASAACVSKLWSSVCDRILSRPKLSCALSLNPSLHDAVNEVLHRVLSEPIRPYFAIVNVGGGFPLEKIMELVRKALGSNIPVIVTMANGIIGRDALTDEFREVKWGALFSGFEAEEYARTVNEGIVLTVGYLPGLKVEAIPLMRPPLRNNVTCVDSLITDIKAYSTAVSSYPFPIGIILFGEVNSDLIPIMEKLDYAMPSNTVIVGDERSSFIYRSGTDIRNTSVRAGPVDAVALVFAQDRDRSSGNIRFHVALSNGVSAVGAGYKVATARTSCTDCKTWLTARREGQGQVLDGDSILNDINDLMENDIESPDLYIGVIKNRKFSVGSEKPMPRTGIAYHGALGGDEMYLYVDGTGIRTGDTFQFYHSNPTVALASIAEVHDAFKNIKLNEDNGLSVFGGLVFACYGRGESFFGHPNADSSPFLENFPGVPFAGLFCGGEVGRPFTTLMDRHGGGSSVSCYLHVYSSVYLVMSHTPPSV